MQEIVLYGRDGCHLCDEARTVLLALLEERRAAGLPSPSPDRMSGFERPHHIPVERLDLTALAAATGECRS